MSDKFREYLDVPQQFIREGNQVSLDAIGMSYFAHAFFEVHH